MAAPITWRNVDGGPNPATAAIPLAYSQQSFNGAFDAFANILQQRQALDQSNAAATGEAAKQAFLDKLSAARTPEQLAAMQASGELDAARQALSPTAQAAVRGADEARLTSLRQQTVATNAYNDQQRALAERPLRDAIASKVVNNDFDGAISDVESSSLADKAVLLGGINKARRDLSQQIYSDADANARRVQSAAQATLTNLNLTEAQRAAAEAESNRKLDTTMGQLAAAYQSSAGNMRSAVEGEASNLFGGRVNLTSLNEDQRTRLDAHLLSKGLPSVADATTGDTEAIQAALARLRDDGATPAQLARASTQLPTLFNTAPSAPMGNDAANIAMSTAKEGVALDLDDASNWNAPGSADARKSYEEIATKIPDIVKASPNGFDAGEDVPYVQALLHDVVTYGLETNNGVRVVPSANDFMAAVRASEGGWLSDRARADDIRARLTRLINSKEGQERILRGEESRRWRAAQKVKEEFREALNPTKK